MLSTSAGKSSSDLASTKVNARKLVLANGKNRLFSGSLTAASFDGGFMRFGDGAWRMLDDVTPVYPARVDDFEVKRNELTLHVSSRMEEARWATLEGHMFTVQITVPAENVFRVRVTHHKGRKRSGPHFEVNEKEIPIEVSTESEDTLRVVSGDAELVLTKKPWSMSLVNRRTKQVVTTSPFKALGLMNKDGEGVFMREQLTLAVGEQVYGLGERFSALTRNGQVVDMWNSDCGTCSDKGYKDVPFFMTNRGFGVLVSDPGRTSFEIGTEQVTRAQFGVKGEDSDYYLILGPTPKQVLVRLGELTGRPALPPAWSFGLWLTTSFTTDYDEATVMSFVDGMRERSLPLHVFHFDCFWMKGHHWVNLEWDPSVFPDPKGMLERMHARGLRICVWINPYIGERSHLFDEGMEKGFLLKRPNGDVYQRPQWQAGMAYVDFTNPAAVAWYQSKLEHLLDMGVDCFKTDFGEEIPTDVTYFDGSCPVKMHNYYTLLYNRAVFELLERKRGRGEAVLFARSATAGCQQFPVHWGGDCYGTFESMAESLRGGLSLTMSGFGYWSHDIGGFESKASPAVYKRWVAFGLMSSHSRLHGSTSYRVPWLYDEEAVDVVRYFTELKCRLMPYLMQAAVEAHRSNVPMMRAMVLEFPEDPTCRYLDRQYVLGSALVVAPVFHDTAAEYYLPEGRYVGLLDGRGLDGSRWYSETHGFMSLPVLLRPNAIVPMSAETTQVDYDYARNVTLVFGVLDGKTELECQLFDHVGQPTEQYVVEQKPGFVRITNRQGATDFSVQFPWLTQAVRVLGGEVAASRARLAGDPGGLVIRATQACVEIHYAD
ncbi:MAG: alpha-xylosidase [Polyangiaceae bacterium]